MKTLTRTIWILSLVSLFTDLASEMLYPVMPIYLKHIGFSVVLIGVLEGVAEATAGLSKGYFGKQSDLAGKRVPFVRLGYALSAISKPMLALFTNAYWIFLARTTDRLGKGIRTGARDALLSDETTAKKKGRVFGFHRSMDTLGAVLGPAAALVYLYYYPEQYRTLFLIAFVPGLLAILLTWLLKDKPVAPRVRSVAPFWAFLGYWKNSPLPYRYLTGGLLFFALFNSSDVFLLLKLKESGMSDTWLIGIYIFYNLVYALCSYPLGILADKVGLKPVFLGGLLLFAVVYAGMAWSSDVAVFGLLFLLYGMYAAATEGIAKAWITNIARREDTATAIGTYTAFQSICTLLASSLTGYIWYAFGAPAAFITSAAAALVVLLFLFRYSSDSHQQEVA
ncbi:MFS transporter [Pontibacter ruber]|uniref:MFS transporter n=1 Tax=Pontibacter ruber TaxID=1343895 RepID=A0ABW5D1D8_9BACT|nr:MFS transporter [Pontibacter ruber]